MSQWISEANEATFEVEVIEQSRHTPILVDFWAEWCGPCKVLGPLLAAAVEARQGTVRLVKINVDQNQGLAEAFQVRGIPLVKAFVDGLVEAEFVGVIDRRSIETFIDSLVPSEEEKTIRLAEELLEADRPEDVTEVVRPLLEAPRYRETALFLLARSFAAQKRFDDAEVYLDQISETNPEHESAQAMRLRFDLMRASDGVTEPALRVRISQYPKDLEARWALAGFLISTGEVRGALEELLEILMRNRQFHEDGARRAMLAIFDEIGINHDLANEYRKQMQIYL